MSNTIIYYILFNKVNIKFLEKKINYYYLNFYSFNSLDLSNIKL